MLLQLLMLLFAVMLYVVVVVDRFDRRGANVSQRLDFAPFSLEVFALQVFRHDCTLAGQRFGTHGQRRLAATTTALDAASILIGFLLVLDCCPESWRFD